MKEMIAQEIPNLLCSIGDIFFDDTDVINPVQASVRDILSELFFNHPWGYNQIIYILPQDHAQATEAAKGK